MNPKPTAIELTELERLYLGEIRRHRTAQVLHSLICRDKDTLVFFGHPQQEGAILIGQLGDKGLITYVPIGRPPHDYDVSLTELGKQHAKPVPA